MEIKGKKVNFLGDSITEGYGVSAPEFSYVNVFAKKFEPALVRNYGISGTRFAHQFVHVPGKPESFDLDFCGRVEGMDADADIVVVYGGTNDFGSGDAPLGTPNDRTPETFTGACHFLMRSLIEKYPTATIVFMTPLHRQIEERENRPPLCEFVSIIRKTAEFYSIPVLDLYANAGICPQIPAQKAAYMKDGVHPGDAGAAKIADMLGKFIKAL